MQRREDPRQSEPIVFRKPAWVNQHNHSDASSGACASCAGTAPIQQAPQGVYSVQERTEVQASGGAYADREIVSDYKPPSKAFRNSRAWMRVVNAVRESTETTPLDESCARVVFPGLSFDVKGVEPGTLVPYRPVQAGQRHIMIYEKAHSTVPISADFLFANGKKYTLVLYVLEGQVEWSIFEDRSDIGSDLRMDYLRVVNLCYDSGVEPRVSVGLTEGCSCGPTLIEEAAGILQPSCRMPPIYRPAKMCDGTRMIEIGASEGAEMLMSFERCSRGAYTVLVLPGSGGMCAVLLRDKPEPVSHRTDWAKCEMVEPAALPSAVPVGVSQRVLAMTKRLPAKNIEHKGDSIPWMSETPNFYVGRSSSSSSSSSGDRLVPMQKNSPSVEDTEDSAQYAEEINKGVVYDEFYPRTTDKGQFVPDSTFVSGGGSVVGRTGQEGRPGATNTPLSQQQAQQQTRDQQRQQTQTQQQTLDQQRQQTQTQQQRLQAQQQLPQTQQQLPQTQQQLPQTQQQLPRTQQQIPQTQQQLPQTQQQLPQTQQQLPQTQQQLPRTQQQLPRTQQQLPQSQQQQQQQIPQSQQQLPRTQQQLPQTQQQQIAQSQQQLPRTQQQLARTQAEQQAQQQIDQRQRQMQQQQRLQMERDARINQGRPLQGGQQSPLRQSSNRVNTGRAGDAVSGAQPAPAYSMNEEQLELVLRPVPTKTLFLNTEVFEVKEEGAYLLVYNPKLLKITANVVGSPVTMNGARVAMYQMPDVEIQYTASKVLGGIVSAKPGSIFVVTLRGEGQLPATTQVPLIGGDKVSVLMGGIFKTQWEAVQMAGKTVGDFVVLEENFIGRVLARSPNRTVLRTIGLFGEISGALHTEYQYVRLEIV